MYSLERLGDVVHVGLRAEEEALLEPRALLAADCFAIGAFDLAVVQRPGGVRQVGTKGAVQEQRLAIKGQGIASRNRNSFRLQRLEHRLTWCAKGRLVDPEQEQVIAVPGAIGGPLLRMDARQATESCCQILAIAIARLRLRFEAVELGIEDRALEFTQAVVARHDMVFIPKPAGDAPAVVD